jgi:hypothetical protein
VDARHKAGHDEGIRLKRGVLLIRGQALEWVPHLRRNVLDDASHRQDRCAACGTREHQPFFKNT